MSSVNINNKDLSSSARTVNLDLVGLCTSLLCALHCSALPILLSLSPLAGLQFLNDPKVEYTFILLSFSIASYALVYGYRRHHQRAMPLVIMSLGFILIVISHLQGSEPLEVVLTTSGAVSIAISHLINWKLISKAR